VKRAGLVVLAIVSVIVQVSLLPALRPLGVVPNLMLVMVTLIGLEGTASSALAVAVAGGVVLDLASGANFGLWTALLVLAALAAGLVHRAGIELVGPTVACVIVAVLTVVEAVVIVLGVAASVSSWPIGLLSGRLVAELVLNLVLTVGLQPLVRRVTPEAAMGGIG